MTNLDPRLGMPGTGVVITGGASGIGLAAARALAAVGRPVALWDINEAGARAEAEAIAARYGVKASGLAVDLGNPQAISPAAQATRAALGSIGGFVHCAGTAPTTGIDGVTPDVFDAGMALHVRAIILLAQAFREDMRGNPGSAIVATASINAWFGNAGIPVYTAAKGAVISLVRSMADELAGDGIRINTVSPGMIDTAIMDPATKDYMHGVYDRRILLGRFGEPEEVGRMIRFLMSNEASYITASEFLVDGGMRHSQRS